MYVLTDAYVLGFNIDTIQYNTFFFICGRFSLPFDIHRAIVYAYHRKYLNIANVRKLV